MSTNRCQDCGQVHSLDCPNCGSSNTTLKPKVIRFLYNSDHGEVELSAKSELLECQDCGCFAGDLRTQESLVAAIEEFERNSQTTH